MNVARMAERFYDRHGQQAAAALGHELLAHVDAVVAEDEAVDTLHQRLVRAVGGVVQYYQNDLWKHDRDQIAHQGSATPFIHTARTCGTFLIPLYPAFHEYYPPVGETRHVLFGAKDRYGILESIGRWFEAIMEIREEHVILYWDGMKLKTIDRPSARKLINDHNRQVRYAWARQSIGGAS